MTQEEKELLLQDLCGRLPYGVRLKIDSDNEHVEIILWKISDSRVNDLFWIEHCRPYLRPISSMTEDEDKEFALIQTDFYSDGWLYPIATANMMDWLNKKHFDYRGLIEKGLALEAPEGMYSKTTCDNCPDKDFCSQSQYIMANCHKLKQL